MSRKGLIYKHSFTNSNKCYIGQTINSMEFRLNSHVSAALSEKEDYTHFERAIRKYGKENLVSEIIEKDIGLFSIISEKDNLLNIREKYWISFYDSFNNGYNSTEGGGGMSGYKKSQESIDKMKNTISNRTDEQKEEVGKNLSLARKKYFEVNNSHCKGRTYEQIMGEEKGKQMRLLRSTENPMNNPEYREKARLNRIEALRINPPASGKDSKLFGVSKTKEHIENMKSSFKKNNHSKGVKNSQAKEWLLISPNGEEHTTKGNLHEFCNNHNIMIGTLKQNMNKIVGKPNRKSSDKRLNTTGWKLIPKNQD